MFVGTSADKVSKPSSSSVQGSQPCRKFEFHEIQIATENFDESLVIGKGGFGKVYKGNVTNGSSVVEAAIKRLDSLSSQGAAEFWAEVETLSMLRHCNLVSLFGYCDHGKEMILVYEYMPNGTLEDHLHKLGTSLSWHQRLKICICAGRGLHYLHTGTGIESGVIHRDVKSSNILLHESWAAKIADFGLSKIGPTNQPSTYVNTLVKGTFGYLDPNYFTTGRLTRKSDVYAFGVVMLEVLCRKQAVDKSLDEEQWGLATWVKESMEEGNLKQIIDCDIRGQISPKCLKEFVRLAERCLHCNPKQRPTMAEALVSLESALILQEKFNNLEPSGRTIFGRIIDMLPFPSNGDNTCINSNKKNEVSKVFVGKIPGIGAIPKAVEGEQVSAGWPSWLVAVAGEATDGWLPRRADTFEKLDKIGQGTYSNVYKARDLTANKFVALKKVRFDNTDPESVKFIAREIITLRRLDHPNIIKLEGLITSGTSWSLYLVFEYMEHDLMGLASLPGVKFTEPQVKCYMKQLLSGLDHCHSRGVLHRDMKGSNLLINDSGILKIAGFSLATFFDHRENMLLTSRVVTLWYRPPELLLGATKYGVAVDLWSTGCILGELYAGKPIMAGRTEVEQLHAIFKLCGSPSEEFWSKSKLPHATVFKPIQPYTRRIKESFRDVPPAAVELMETLLAIDPSQRGTALFALKSEFFTTKPHACDPSSLPNYPPSKEIDVKLREEELRRQRTGGHSQKIDKESLGKSEHQAVPAPDANAVLIESMQNGNGYKGIDNKIHFSSPLGASSIDQILKDHERQCQESVRRARLVKNRLTKLKSEVTSKPIQ